LIIVTAGWPAISEKAMTLPIFVGKLMTDRNPLEAVNKLENEVVLNTPNGSWGILQVNLLPTSV
jgi:hypothetical protein